MPEWWPDAPTDAWLNGVGTGMEMLGVLVAGLRLVNRRWIDRFAEATTGTDQESALFYARRLVPYALLFGVLLVLGFVLFEADQGPRWVEVVTAVAGVLMGMVSVVFFGAAAIIVLSEVVSDLASAASSDIDGFIAVASLVFGVGVLLQFIAVVTP